MASPMCGHCEGHVFEIKQVTPKNSAFKVYFVQCASCGVPVGVMDFYNIGSLLKRQQKALKKLGAKLGVSLAADLDD